MTDTLPFIQGQDYEGVLATFTKADGSALDISGASELEYDVFDRTALKFSGSKTGGEIDFLTDGQDGKFVFTPGATDMNEAGIFRGEARATLGGKILKKQKCVVKIIPKAPTS